MSKKNGTLYIGVTGDILFRIYEHKHKLHKGFTSRYDVKMLVYYEQYNDIYQAIQREKQLKKWERKWKLRIIEEMNPEWTDLYYELGGKEFDLEMKKEIELEMKKSGFPPSRE